MAQGAHDEHFELALAHHARAKAPFETARTELVFGERLRREGRRKDAIEWLERASDGFARLGAAPWLKRGDRELAACGRVRSGETCFPISQCKRFRWPSLWPEGRRAVRQGHSCS